MRTQGAAAREDPASSPAMGSVYQLTPMVHKAVLFATACMLYYPLHMKYAVGDVLRWEDRNGDVGCTLKFGYWRVTDVSHVVLWALILLFAIVTYPRELIMDEERDEFRYVMQGFGLFGEHLRFPLRVAFDEVLDVRPVGPCFNGIGYIRVSTADLTFVCRPKCGANILLFDHAVLRKRLAERSIGSGWNQGESASSSTPDWRHTRDDGRGTAAGAAERQVVGGAANPQGAIFTI